MAEAIVNSFAVTVGRKHPIDEIVLIPSGNGRFEVTCDGDLIYSKKQTGRHAQHEEVVAEIRKRLS